MERLNELLVSYKYPLLIGLVGSILIFSGSIVSVFSSPTEQTKEFPKESLTESSTANIKVDIAGAVQEPGVYELKKDTRIEELIKEAGGFKENVNAEYVSKSLNLSQKVSDSQKIYIPFKGEKNSIHAVAGASIALGTENTKVNLNTATQSQLEELSGVGPSTSSKLIAGRPYQSPQDLLTKKIIGKATFEKIKDLIEI